MEVVVTTCKDSRLKGRGLQDDYRSLWGTGGSQRPELHDSLNLFNSYSIRYSLNPITVDNQQNIQRQAILMTVVIQLSSIIQVSKRLNTTLVYVSMK